MPSDSREVWTVPAPYGGWASPWPQAAELASEIPSEQWTLIGGLMVQLHAVRAGLPASRVTVDVDMVLHIETGKTTLPDVLGALVLKGAAYKGDPRDRNRHLDDAAVLACAIENPMAERKRMAGSDHGRVRVLAERLERLEHKSWSGVPVEHRERGHKALQLIVQNPVGPRDSVLGRLRH